MLIFIDFDDVIFNTKKFREDLAKIFSLFGISKEEYEDSYFDPDDQRAIKVHNQDEQIERLKKKVSFDEKALRNSLDDFMQDSSGYVFEDVMPFVGLHRGCVIHWIVTNKITTYGILKNQSSRTYCQNRAN